MVVIEVLQGQKRKLSKLKEILRLQSHCLFREHFCLMRRANGKGHVERLLGFARWKFPAPVPRVDSLATLNRQLLDRCQRDLAERTRGKPAAKQALLSKDQVVFLPLPKGVPGSTTLSAGSDASPLYREVWRWNRTA